MQDKDAFVKALKPNTKMIWIETPSNPMMRLIDIKKISELSKEHNPSILVVVDNTFLTPVFQVVIVIIAKSFKYYVPIMISFIFNDFLHI